MSKMNLTEATMLALQGKLTESKKSVAKRIAKTKTVKTENIDVNVDEKTNVSVMGNETVVETPDATIIVDKKEDEFVPETSDDVMTTGEDVVEVPVDGDETIVPDVDLPLATDATEEIKDDVDLPLETEIKDGEEEKEESKSLTETISDPEEEDKAWDKAEKLIDAHPEDFEHIGDNCFKYKNLYVEIRPDTLNDDNEKDNPEMDFAVFKTEEDMNTDYEQNIGVGYHAINDIKEYWNYVRAYVDAVISLLSSLDKITENKKVESVEIEVSDDGKEVEVTTDNGEAVEVVDETPTEETETEVDDELETDVEDEAVIENKKLENSKRVCSERKAGNKKSGIKAESKRAVKENKVAEKVEKIMAKRIESKKSFKYNSKSFNESLTNFYRKNTKTVESAEISKLNIVGKNIVLEAKLTLKEGVVKTTKLEMKPITTAGAFTRYAVTEINKIKTENKSNILNATMLTMMNKYNVTECKYINKK